MDKFDNRDINTKHETIRMISIILAFIIIVIGLGITIKDCQVKKLDREIEILKLKMDINSKQ